MNYIKISKTDIANGTGVRVVLWVAGCEHHCKGCHNQSTWDYKAGQQFVSATMGELYQALDKPWIKGLTVSGGDPLAPGNVEMVHAICSVVKEMLPEKDIWIYTGYTFEELDEKQREVVENYCDMLVDGEYVENLRDITLQFRGSSNQRLLDVRQIKSKRNHREEV